MQFLFVIHYHHESHDWYGDNWITSKADFRHFNHKKWFQINFSHLSVENNYYINTILAIRLVCLITIKLIFRVSTDDKPEIFHHEVLYDVVLKLLFWKVLSHKLANIFLQKNLTNSPNIIEIQKKKCKHTFKLV